MSRINHNVPAMVTGAALRQVGRRVAKSLEKLSTGLRINRASDDAAGLSVSEQLRTQVRGLAMGNRNIQDGISLLNIAEGALIEIEDMLQRMRELSIQAANDTLTVTERSYVQVEFDQLTIEIDRIANGTQFNSQKLLNGTGVWASTNGGVLHVGPNDDVTSDLVTVYIGAITSGGMGIDSASINVLSQTNAEASITALDVALTSVNTIRADLGAKTNRLEHALNNQENQEQNMQAAESVIRDADFAFETTEFTRNQILQQSSTAMLAQANVIPQNVLQLLG
ncbi:MAG: flagellin [Chitinivibrionales bacterium]|nr:flagellin [Chitinivibrionales bacterium]MBD3396542.1 flagellin [Chitinivibrionales bacterium]